MKYDLRGYSKAHKVYVLMVNFCPNSKVSSVTILYDSIKTDRKLFLRKYVSRIYYYLANQSSIFPVTYHLANILQSMFTNTCNNVISLFINNKTFVTYKNSFFCILHII